MDVISNDVNALVERLQLPTIYQRLWESLFSATRMPSAENTLKLQQHHAAAENAFNVAISTAYQTLPIELWDYFIATVTPFCVLVSEARRYLETLMPMLYQLYPPTSGKTETPKAGIDGSDREGGGEFVNIESGGGGGSVRGGGGGDDEDGGKSDRQKMDVKNVVNLLEKRFTLPASVHQLTESLSSAKMTSSAENVQRLEQSLLATVDVYNDAFLHLEKMELCKSDRVDVWNSVAKPYRNLRSEIYEFQI